MNGFDVKAICASWRNSWTNGAANVFNERVMKERKVKDEGDKEN